MALGFATILIVTDHLGEAYGSFIGAQRFVGMFIVLAQFGLGTLLVRAVAARRAEAGATFGTILALRLILCTAFAILVSTTALVFDYLPEHRGLVYGFILLSVIGVFAATPLSLFEGFELMGRSAALKVLRSVATFGAVILVVVLKGGSRGVMLAYIFSGTVQLLVALALTRRLTDPLQTRVRVEQMIPMLRTALLFVAIGLAFTALRSLDVVMLTRLSTTVEVAQYGAALNFVEVTLALPLLAQRALFPALSRLGATEDAAGVAYNSLLVFSVVLVPSAIGMSLLAEHAVSLYPSGDFADAAPVLSILAISLAFLGSTMVCATYLTAIGRLWTILGAYALALPLQVIANLILIDLAGAIGVAIATVIAHAALAIGLVVVVVAAGTRVPFAAFARHLAAAAGMALVILATRNGPMVVAVCAGGLSYAVFLFLFSRPESIERRLLGVVLERWRK